MSNGTSVQPRGQGERARRTARMLLTACLLSALLAPAWAADPAVRSGALAAADAPAQSMPFLGGFVTRTEIRYPNQVDGWQAGKESRYDDPRLGVGVTYKDTRADEDSTRGWITLYFYPVGVVPAEQAREHMQELLQQLVDSAGQPGAYEQVSLGEQTQFTVSLPGGAADSTQQAVWAQGLSFTHEGKSYHSAIAMLVRDMYYIKVRMSVDNHIMPVTAVVDQLRQFTTALVQQTEFASTGRCWQPIPVRIQPRLDEVADGQDAGEVITGEDGQVVARLYADRVDVASRPVWELPRIQQHVQRVNDSRYPGCRSPQQLEQAAGAEDKTLRHLCLDYAPPAPAKRPSRG